MNSTPNPSLDTTSLNKPNTKTTLSNNIVKKIIDHQLIDTFRTLFPTAKQFTWANSSQSKARLDQIWISQSHTMNLLSAAIYSANFITNSDHAIAYCHIDIGKITQNELPAKSKTPNTIFNTKNALPEHWEKYRNYVARETKRSFTKDFISKDINKDWNKFKDIILKAAHKHIPKNKKAKIKPSTSSPSKHNCKIIIKLQRLLYWSKKEFKGNQITTKIKKNIEHLIQEIKSEGIDLNEFPNKPYQEDQTNRWLNNLKQPWSKIKTAIKNFVYKEQTEEIKQALNRHNTWFEIDKKRMLKSILHNKTSVSIDKLISEDKSQVFLYTEEVKEEIK
jgi:ribosomal protein S20